MNLLSREAAVVAVNSIKDAIDKPVDAGIFDALVDFLRVIRRLGGDTVASCEGHDDWGNPYPAIEAGVPYHDDVLPSWYKFWLRAQRRRVRHHNGHHFSQKQEVATSLILFLSREMLEYYQGQGVDIDPILRFHVVRHGPFDFVIKPIYSCLSEGMRSSGEFHTLDGLLVRQRKAFAKLASCIAARAEDLTSFEGIPEHGCSGCGGRI